MPKRKKSSLGRKYKKSRTSQSEEDYNTKLEAHRISDKKCRQNQSSEQRAKVLEGKRHRNKLDNSRIMREHNESIYSQVTSRTRGALKRKHENEINPASKKTKKVILLVVHFP